MRATYLKLMACVGAATLAFAVVPGAAAQCGLPNKVVKPANWSPYGVVHPTLLRVDDDDQGNREPSIVGMWHVIFTATQENGGPIPTPSGTLVVDNALSVWHSDGTEIMNSVRPAQDGNFCLGVWRHNPGKGAYHLNHIPWQGNIWDPTAPAGTIGPPQDGVQIIEDVVVDPNGKSYSGTFSITAYDSTGTVYVVFTGNLAATRVTPDTPFTDLL